MMLLAAFTTEEERVKTSIVIVWVKELSLKRDPAHRGWLDRCIGLTSAGNEAVELERKKCSITDAAALILAAAHHGQHICQRGDKQIGRAPGRERVCQYVYIPVVVVSLKKKK